MSGVSTVVDHLFRHEAGRLVATLTRILGMHNLDLAEDVVQDTLYRALEVWKYKGTPDNPSAWLTRVARNRAIDLIREAGDAPFFMNFCHYAMHTPIQAPDHLVAKYKAKAKRMGIDTTGKHLAR